MKITVSATVKFGGNETTHHASAEVDENYLFVAHEPSSEIQDPISDSLNRLWKSLPLSKISEAYASSIAGGHTLSDKDLEIDWGDGPGAFPLIRLTKEAENRIFYSSKCPKPPSAAAK